MPIEFQVYEFSIMGSGSHYLIAHVPLERRCNKTAWYSILTFVICTFFAQVVLTARSEIPPCRPEALS